MNIPIANNWYTDFFAGLNCEMWERAVTTDWTKREADFLVETLTVSPGAALLDIGVLLPTGYCWRIQETGIS